MDVHVGPTSAVVAAVVALTVFHLGRLLRRAYLHPYPGPFIAKLSPLWLWYHAYFGTEASAIRNQHLKYNSSIVRIAPNHLSISNTTNDPEEVNPITQIYVTNGGLPKPAFYSNFDIDGHATIFSTRDHEHRAVRAKAVVPMFAPSRVRESFVSAEGVCRKLVDKFIERLRQHRSNAARSDKAHKVDISDECRRLATDVVTGYLYGHAYGSLDEDGLLSASKKEMSHFLVGTRSIASPFVDSYVTVGRFFLLPPTLFNVVAGVVERLFPNGTEAHSSNLVDKYGAERISAAKEGEDTYQSRLLFNAGISRSEVNTQLKDLIFAGTDSTGMTLATLCFHLIRNPGWMERLKGELTAQTNGGDKPMLDATVKEGLRLGLANPTRLARLVPKGSHGVEILGHSIPPDTVVGCQSYSLHNEPSCFANPFNFHPERWLEASPIDQRRMNANMIPFGAGTRQCIARNLAHQELLWATEALVCSGVLEGMTTVSNRIEKYEWFNSQVKDNGGINVWVPAEG